MIPAPKPRIPTVALAAVLAVALSAPAATALAADGPKNKPAASAAPTTTHDLTVNIEGIKKAEGNLRVGLYDTAEGFVQEQDIEGKTVPVEYSTETVVFEDLPEGEYALKVFHDEDADGDLDTTFGIPSEPYGFSNDASDPFSAPEWEETRFPVEDGDTEHTIDLD